MAGRAKAAGKGSLVSQVGEALRKRILAGEYAPGARLPSEAQLTEAYGVSRTVIREAMAALRADGLVEPRQGAGIFVLEAPPPSIFSPQALDPARISSTIEILEFRTGVEAEAAGLAALRRSPAQEEAILERHDALRACLKAGEPTAEADFALHLAIAEAANNPRFREFLEALGTAVIPRAALKAQETEEAAAAYIARLDEEHGRIVAAISNGDEEAARAAMRAHLRGGQARYRALLRSGRLPHAPDQAGKP
ncbi:FadR/GntR family transcriptional regulator [Neomegalonema sp.]|uniref:FadR/GntR family transcriptional regulator n=1 Tax=Neomegalonema sp. TaxID=2039713 RepID=UPI00261D0AF8|nr:FadR/GntR family transcriptional regulator [Neomegalonema sp.]